MSHLGGGYVIELVPRAQRFFLSCTRDLQAQLYRTMKALESNPRSSSAEKLVARADSWRVRSGDYRIIFVIDDVNRIITVTKIGHRGDVYRR